MARKHKAFKKMGRKGGRKGAIVTTNFGGAGRKGARGY